MDSIHHADESHMQVSHMRLTGDDVSDLHCTGLAAQVDAKRSSDHSIYLASFASKYMIGRGTSTNNEHIKYRGFRQPFPVVPDRQSGKASNAPEVTKERR